MISRKRIFGIVLFAFASLITFAFANQAGPVDNAPSIDVNPSTVKIVQGSNYDVMKGVTVTDDNDTLTAVADLTDTTGLSIGDHTITYTATDSSDNTATATRLMNVLDPKEDADADGYTNGEEVLAGTDFLDVNSHPSYAKSSTITLNTNNIYTMEVHGVVPSFNATANDVADGNVAVVIINNINADVVGGYTVTFRATDSLGNLVTITREFNVVDTTKPVITLNGAVSYKVVIGQTTYTDENAIVTDNYDTTSIISGVVNGNPLVVGTYTLDYNFADANLNVADKVIRTINVLDPLADEDHDGYTNGEEVIAHTNFDDETSMPDYDKNPTITIGAYETDPTNQDIIVDVTTDEGVLNFASHTFTENGGFDFIAVDVLGNTTTKTVTITNIDKKFPEITIGNYITTPTNKDIIVSATTDEGTLNEDTRTFIVNGSFNFVATDAAGNITTKTVTITNIDKIAPESPALVLPLNGASVKGNSVINTWTVVSDAVKYIYESYNDAAATSLRWNQTILAPTHSKTATNVADSTFWWRVKAVDAVGNESSWSDLRKLIVDTTKPIITVGNYITTPTNQDITVNVTTNEGTLNSNSHLFTANNSFEFVATDLAGNVSTKTVTITNIDKQKPVITLNGGDMVIEVNTPFTDPSVIITDNSGEILTPTKTVYYSPTGADSTWVGALNNEVNPAKLGIYAIWYGAVDSSGNIADSVRRYVTVRDTIKPVITLNGGDMVIEVNTPFIDPSVIITDNSGEILTPTKTVYYSPTGADSTWVGALNNEVNPAKLGKYAIWYGAVDSSGNVADSVRRYVTVRDTTKPVITKKVASDIYLEVGSVLPSINNLVTAIDNYDGNITARVYVLTMPNMNILGTHLVEFYVKDSSGNEGYTPLRVHVVDTTKPVITKKVASDIYLEVGSVLPSINNLVTAIDNYDGDITSRVYVLTMPNMNILGTYLVEFYVKDSNGNEGYTPLRVHVVDTAKPVIILNGGDMELVIGQTFTDPGVATVSDNYATLTLANVSVLGIVNPNLEGTYTLTYSVSDGYNTSSVTRTVVVKPLITELSVSDPSGATSYNGFVIEFNRDFVVINPNQIKLYYEYSVDGGAYVNANLVKYPGQTSTWNFGYPGMWQIGTTKILSGNFWGIDYFKAGTIPNGGNVSMQENSANTRLPEIYSQVQAGKQVKVRTVITFILENGTAVTYKLTPVQYN